MVFKTGEIPWNKGLVGALVHSDETKKKMSIANKGRAKSAETLERMSRAQKGHTTSEETRLKISAANTGKKMSSETREKMSRANKGRKPWQTGLSSDSDERVAAKAEARRQYFIEHPEERTRWAERAAGMPHYWRDTLPERMMRSILEDERIAFSSQVHIGITCPDFVVPIGEKRLAIYVDGCYYHGCPEHYSNPREFQRYNISRDRRVEAYLDSIGVKWVRISECKMKSNPDEAREILREALRRCL